MYLSARLASRPVPPPPFQIYSATSSDLYTWTLDAGVRQTGGSAPAALLNPDGSVMLVFNAELRLGTGPPAYISTATALDGLTFSPKVPTSLGGAAQPFTPAARACPLGPDRDHGGERALAHARSRTGAQAFLRHAQKLAGSRAKLERDGCTHYEPAIIGLKSKRAAQALLRRAKSAGFAGASIERS